MAACAQGGRCDLQGNHARYINHSCDPNAYTKIVCVDGAKHVAIIAARAIAAGEEIFYDYKVGSTAVYSLTLWICPGVPATV